MQQNTNVYNCFHFSIGAYFFPSVSFCVAEEGLESKEEAEEAQGGRMQH